jgi:hypothetical protein
MEEKGTWDQIALNLSVQEMKKENAHIRGSVFHNLGLCFSWLPLA